MTLRTFTGLPKAVVGDRVTVLSPAFAAPAISEAVHEQAMRRLTESMPRNNRSNRNGRRMPSVTDLAGAILLLETSEELPAADQVKDWVRALGERGIVEAAAGVLVARPPTSRLGEPAPSSAERSQLRAEQREAITGQISAYNSDAVVCVGVPFGDTRPQWILPHGGLVRLDGTSRTVTANYS
jgi:muramoyltetrapeptide carboxypeptidase LdcA involved in peptidoglycan recycling